MSKLATFQQAKKLKEIGYREMVWQYFCGGEFKRSKIICDYNADSNMDGKVLISAPTIYEALDWLREEKGIECGVFVNTDGVQTWYSGRALEDNGIICVTDAFSTHSLAKSALLDEVIKYLTEKI